MGSQNNSRALHCGTVMLRSGGGGGLRQVSTSWDKFRFSYQCRNSCTLWVISCSWPPKDTGKGRKMWLIPREPLAKAICSTKKRRQPRRTLSSRKYPPPHHGDPALGLALLLVVLIQLLVSHALFPTALHMHSLGLPKLPALDCPHGTKVGVHQNFPAQNVPETEAPPPTLPVVP